MAGERTTTRSSSISGGGLTIGGGTAQGVTSDNINTFQKTFPANTTNGRVTFPIAVANVKAIAIIADKAATVKTNSTTTPDDTIALVAGVGRNWLTGDPTGARFVTANVTDLYVTCTDACVIKLLVSEDATPVLGDT